MEWDDDDNESNENSKSQSDATDKSEASKLNLRKSFIPHKKRVILQELEPISENNILEDRSDYLSKSINFNLRTRQKNMNPQCTYKKADSVDSVAAPPETPPAALRQRIIQALEMQEYLEKELDELKDFTTNEKQVLAAEMGAEELRKNLDEVKNELEISNREKDSIFKELEELKRRYVDEQTEKQILETKWKHREDDLKKSLEEAWSLLRIKEGRITKMNEKISFLYSEREKVKDLNITFGGQLLPTVDEFKIQTIEQNISELFELSCHNSLEHGRTINCKYEIDCRGDNLQNSGLSEVDGLREELAKCKHSIETHKKQIEDLSKNLADKDFLISTYEKNLSEIRNYVSDYVSDDLICVNIDNHTHTTSFEKMKCDINFFLSKYSVNLESKECENSGFMCPFESHSDNNDVDKEKKGREMVCQHSQTDRGLEDGKLKDISTVLLSDVSIQTFDIDVTDVEDKVISSGPSFLSNDQRENVMDEKTDNTIKECRKENLVNCAEKEIMDNKIIKFEEEIKNNDVEINILKTKLAEYEKGLLKPMLVENSSQTVHLYINDRSDVVSNCIEDKNSDISHKFEDIEESENRAKEITILHCKISEYEEKLQCKVDKINKLQADLTDFKEKIKIKDEEICELQSNISNYTEKYKNKEEEVHWLQSNVVGHEELLNSHKDEINKLQNSISAHEEKLKNKDEEINLLQIKITGYEETIKNNAEEIAFLQSRVKSCEETLKSKEEEICKLQTNISNYTEKYKSKEEEIHRLQSNVVVHEETLNGYKEEISKLQSSISANEDIIINKDEEINKLQISISACEEKLINKDEEINILQITVKGFEETVKNKDEEDDMLQSKVMGCEETINKNKEEICELQTNVSNYKELLKNKEEEIHRLQSNVVGHEEILNSHKGEINKLLSSISANEEKLKNKDEENNLLQIKITSYEETIKNNAEEIAFLRSRVKSCEESIKNKEEEICKLQTNVSDFVEKYRIKEEEILKLHSNVVGNEEILSGNKEEITKLQSSISANEEELKNKDVEINLLQIKINGYEETIKNNAEEMYLLHSRVKSCEETIQNKEEEIQKVQSNIVGHKEILNSHKEEISKLHSNILANQDIIINKDEEMKKLQISISACEEKLKNKNEEIGKLQSKLACCEETIENNKEEISELQTIVSNYEEKYRIKEEEIQKLQTNIVGHEEILNDYKNEISKLQSDISESEEKLKNKVEEINCLQIKVNGYEETIKNKVEEICQLQTNISDYTEKYRIKEEEIQKLHSNVVGKEEILNGYKEEISKLQSSISANKDIHITKDEEMNLLQIKLTGYEETIKKYVEKMDLLQCSVKGYEETINNKEEEIHQLQSNVVGHEEILNGYKEEISKLQSSISANQDLIINKDEEMKKLQISISGFEETIKNKDEKINILRSKVTECEETIKNKEEEIHQLQSNVVGHEEILNGYKEEISKLQSSISANQDIIINKDEEINKLQISISACEEKLINKDEEINIFQITVKGFEETVKNKDEENDILQSKVMGCEETINKNKEEICELQTNISNYKELLKNKEEELHWLQRNVVGHEKVLNSYKEEISKLQSDISDSEQKLKNQVEEINLLQTQITGYEETIKNKDEEINMFQSKVTGWEETIKNKEEEICELQTNISHYDEKFRIKEEEIQKLYSNVVGNEEILNSYKEEISKLQCSISDNEEKLKNKAEEINLIQIKITGYEETIKNKDEEINMLLSKVTRCEETIKNKEKEICELQTNISHYDEKYRIKEEEIQKLYSNVVGNEEILNSYKEEISKLLCNISQNEEILKKKAEEINLIQIKITGYEETIKNKDEEINMLLSKVTGCEDTMKNKEEEIQKLQSSIVGHEEILNSYKEENNILLSKISGYEVKTHGDGKEINNLLNTISSYEDKMKNNEEEIKMLLSNVLEHEHKISELKDNALSFEGKIKQKEDELNREKNIVQKNLDKINILHAKVSDYEEKIKRKEEEIIALQNEVSIYKDEISHYEEELKNKVLFYEKTIGSYADEVNLLKHNISKNEVVISEKLPLVNIASGSVKNYDDLNNTACSSASGNISVAYSHNDVTDVEYDNTLNFTTLDSSSQLEQSVFISKLPQTDNSIKEYDPLASVSDLSYTDKELDITLTEQLINPRRFDESNPINTTYENYNVNENIKALICLFNNEGDVSNTNFDEISKQLLAVKEILKPKEDYVIYSFCHIIEHLLNKEFVNKKIWNEKMLVVKETLSNVQVIKDSFLQLKDCFSSLENITSQNHETLNSHFKNLFLCNRELSTENVLLKEQLKVSLLSEEKLGKINELMRDDLSNTLQAEKDLMNMKEHNKHLEERLKEKCKKENDIILFIDKIANLLNPNLSWPTDEIIENLEQIYSLLMESICQVGCEDISNIGFIQFIRNLLTQNSVLKQKIDKNIKVLKGDLTSLNLDIPYQFNNLNADFQAVSCKLSELYEQQEQDTSVNNILRDNVKNLVLENRNLKEELNNLRIQNSDLSSTSKEYSELMGKYKNLNNIIHEKDDLLSDQVKFQKQVCLFVDSLKDLYFMKDFEKLNDSFTFSDKSNYIDFLVWLMTFLHEVHCIHKSLLENSKYLLHSNLSEVVSELVKEKNDMSDAYCSLNSEFNCIKQSLLLLPENIINIKNTLNAISSDVLKSKLSLIQDLVSINKSMETLLSSCGQRDMEYDSYKCDSEKSYNELNEKYLELQHLYENIEIELKSSKTLIQEFNEEKDNLRREVTEHEYKCNELRKLISSYEMELLNYKNVHNSLKQKIIDVEKEKGKIEENYKQNFNSGEHDNLESDKNKLTEIIQNITELNCTIKESCGDLISCDVKNLGDDFVHLENIIFSLLEVRNKSTTLELSYAALLSERNELLIKIESLNNLIKESVDAQTSLKNEIQALIEKNSEQEGTFYPEKVIELLKLLEYKDPTKIDDLAWTFIEETINKYKLVANQNTDCDKFKLEEKILYLESQLCDAQDFKSKFSKELHMLKPDLDISYLMSLSLADLQKTMIIAIIEKEKDVIEDYEMKLALSTDRIQQLEEQQKRKEAWLQEIEKENERLSNECKQIQNENETLKTDVNSKLHKIYDLEHQITQQINGEQIKEYIKEREDSNNQLETAANEKHTLQLSMASLNDKLQNKSLECEEVYSSLQKKAEVIFGLEKVLSKCKTENANLEKEVQHLRESMVLNLNNFNDNKQALERDLVNYKIQINELQQLLSDTQKEVQTENKSVSADLYDVDEMELQIEDSLSNHLAKIESLNLKIDDLNSQLKQQNNKFDEEFENQAKFIESLEEELNMANKRNAELKNNISNHNQKEEASPDSTSIEILQSEIISLRELNISLQNEKALLLKEKQELEQSRIMHKEEESLVDNMKKEMDSIKSKLSDEEVKNKTKQEQIDNLLLKLDSFAKDLTSAQNTIEDLLKQNLENKQLKEEVNSLISDLEHCKLEIDTLIKEKEIKENQLSECFSNLNLEKEITCSVKSALEQTRQEFANLKTENIQLIEKHCKDLQLQKDLCSKLNSDIGQLKEMNALQENELLCLKNELREKVAYLEEIRSNCHSEKSCPFMKEAEDIKTKHYDLNKQLERERETFKSWKTNLEEDLHCKLLKISDLELKLKKETHLYKEALMSNSELHQKLQESVEKFKRLEDKIAIQRDVFIKEKSKSDIDLQNKEKLLIELENKLLSVKTKCEEFSKDICMFLEQLSAMLKVDVIDLSSAMILINNITVEKQMLVKELKKTQEIAEQSEKGLKEAQGKAEFFEKEIKQAREMVEKLEEELKEAQEKAEQLEEECEELNNDIKYHENEIGNLYKNGKLNEEKWLKEKEELEKMLSLQIHELREKNCSQEKVILSLHMKIENYDKSIITCNADKKILESEKLELERKTIDLEKTLQSLKNQEISYLDGIKREINHLKLELVNKNKAISKLEMRLESDTLPFQKKAELAERKVEELTKELRILKQSQSLKQMSSVLTSPMAAGLEMSPSHKNKDKVIERLEQEVKQLITEKSALKLLAQNRRIQINELKEQLGKKDVNSFQD